MSRTGKAALAVSAHLADFEITDGEAVFPHGVEILA